ncbi:MAG: hypothetical protein ACE5GJ_13655 [Gemmatimonadota bacterium]
MTSDDQIRPYHAKGAGEETADVVAAVLQHAAEREKSAHAKPPPKKQPKWMLPLGINLSVLALYLLIAPPSFVTMNPIEGPDQASQEESMRVAMWLQAQQIEKYRIDHGRLPETVAELGRTLPQGMEYHRTGDSFQLIGVVGDTPVVYDSSQPQGDFEGVVAGRLSGG